MVNPTVVDTRGYIMMLFNKLSSQLAHKLNLTVFSVATFVAVLSLPNRAYAACVKGVGPGGAIPTWYKYMMVGGENCVEFVWPQGLALIGAALVELLLVIGGFVAVLFIIVGGVQMIMSRGEPDKIAGARRTILNALIGMVITIMSVAIVRMVAGAIS
jgi:hypothetical protein